MNKFGVNFGEGFSAGWDLSSLILSGLILGLAVDWWLGTRPWFVVGFVVVAALWGFRKAKQYTSESIKRDG